MKTNLTLTCLLNSYNKAISQMLADKLELYYLNLQELMEYNLMNEEEILQTCGAEYLEGLKNKTIKDVSNYDNSVISIPHNYLANKNYVTKFKNRSIIIYLAMSEKIFDKKVAKISDEEEKKECEIQKTAFKEQDALCREVADLVIDIDGVSEKKIVAKIVKSMEKYYV